MDGRLEQNSPINLFFSYASEDEALRQELEKHLSILKRQKLITSWRKCDISAGMEREQEVHRYLRNAQIILLLISPDFLASDFCYGTELAEALKRHEAQSARVIPIIIRPVSWEGAPFGKLQMLPKDGVPITSTRWFSRDEAWLNVVEGLRSVIAELVATRLDSQAAPAPRIWHVPYRRNLFFTGREEQLQQLRTRLTVNNTAALTQTHAINGLGGIGKTQMALEYAYRYQQHYRSIFWVSAATPETLLSDFVRLASVIGLPFQEHQDTQRIVAAIKAWLAEQQEWLLIFDNADDVELVSDYLPEGATSRGHILLTTRSQATGNLAYALEVTQMNKEEGALLLLRRAKLLSPEAAHEQATLIARAEAEAIVDELDGLPLALDQAGAYIEETGCSLSGYLELYRQRRKDLLGRRGRLALDHPEPVAAIWDLSFRLIEQANPAAADLLRLCAFLDPDAISEEILTKGCMHLGPVLQPVAADAFALNQAIEELRKFSLIRRNADARMLSLHRLVQVVLKDGMDESAQKMWAERVIRVVGEALPPRDRKRWLDWQPYLPQIQACARLIEEYDLTFEEAVTLLYKSANFLRTYAFYEQAQILYLQVLALRKRTFGSEHPRTATILDALGLLTFFQGKYPEAEEFYLQALAIREKALGSEHFDAVATLDHLAVLYYYRGKYTQAEEFYLRVLEVREKAPEPEYFAIADTFNGLANLYQTKGKHAQAEEMYRRALEIREKVLGPEHSDTAYTLYCLGRLYYYQERYAQAEEFYLRALSANEKTLGLEHPDIAVVLNGLVKLYRIQGKFAEAESCGLRTLSIREKVLGPEHSDTANTLNNLGDLYRDMGEYTQAEALYLRALTIRKKVFGPEDLHTAGSLESLAELYKLQKMYDEAIHLSQQTLTIREKVWKQGHSSISRVRRNLVSLHLNQGRYKEAESLCKQALAIDEDTYGLEHPEVLADLKVYVALLQQSNRNDESIPLQGRVNELYDKFTQARE